MYKKDRISRHFFKNRQYIKNKLKFLEKIPPICFYSSEHLRAKNTHIGIMFKSAMKTFSCNSFTMRERQKNK